MSSLISLLGICVTFEVKGVPCVHVYTCRYSVPQDNFFGLNCHHCPCILFCTWKRFYSFGELVHNHKHVLNGAVLRHVCNVNFKWLEWCWRWRKSIMWCSWFLTISSCAFQTWIEDSFDSFSHASDAKTLVDVTSLPPFVPHVIHLENGGREMAMYWQGERSSP